MHPRTPIPKPHQQALTKACFLRDGPNQVAAALRYNGFAVTLRQAQCGAQGPAAFNISSIQPHPAIHCAPASFFRPASLLCIGPVLPPRHPTAHQPDSARPDSSQRADRRAQRSKTASDIDLT